MAFRLLIINPGSTSTKIGVYEDEKQIFEKTLRHSAEEIGQFETIYSQKDFRKEVILNVLRENNFDVIAAASTVSHHSIFDGVAVGRPDNNDIEKINEFAQKCMEKIESGESLKSELPGNRPYVDYKQLPFIVSCDVNKCVFCYDCVTICPEKAVPDDDPADVDLDACTRCTACIHICQEDARSFTGEAFEAKKPAFESANSARKEVEYYL